MADSKSELLLVILEFSDGTIKYLEGYEAERWASEVDVLMAVEGATHSHNSANFQWKEISKEHASALFLSKSE